MPNRYKSWCCRGSVSESTEASKSNQLPSRPHITYLRSEKITVSNNSNNKYITITLVRDVFNNFISMYKFYLVNGLFASFVFRTTLVRW